MASLNIGQPVDSNTKGKPFTVGDESDEDDVPLAVRLKSIQKVEAGAPEKYALNADDDDDDLPLSVRLQQVQQQKIQPTVSHKIPERFNPNPKIFYPPKPLQKTKPALQSDAPNERDVKTPSKKDKNKTDKAIKKITEKAPLKVVTIADKPDLQSQEPKPKKKKTSEQTEEGDLEDDEHRWWEDPSFLEEGSVKWTTLEHNGVLFPPDYVAHGIPLVYDGRDVVLPAEAEEVASFFAQLLETEHAKNEIFVANFWSDFRALLVEKFPTFAQKIVSFEKCDFGKMLNYFNEIKEARKGLSKEDKAKIKLDKKNQEEKYMFCMLDGRKERVGNFRVEPPGLFRGRGKHPKAGKLKTRITPEQITINIGEGAPTPQPPPGHSWGKVIHNNEVAWLACWIENINGNYKYVWFAANSSLKGQSDFKKFEKARELKNHIERIRKTIQRELKDEQPLARQRATALWLIDVLALRAGNEKGEDEADTVGCCSLRVEHIKLEEPNFVIFDFLGKDSIRYYNRVPVEAKIFQNLKMFMRQKNPTEMLFDKLTTSSLNSYLDTLMPGLTAKVFRTFNASFTFQRLLGDTPQDLSTVHEKMLYYNRSNREVAVLCNHQRAVPKTHHVSIAKLKDKVDLAKLQRHRIKQALKNALPLAQLKEKESELEPESDLDDERIAEIEQLEERLELEKAERAAQKKQLHSQSSQPDGADSVDEQSQDLPTHCKNSHSFNTLSADKLEKTLERFNAKISALKMQLIDRDENKTTSLGTSKINYLDPRISVSWCKKHDVPIEKIFSKTLRDKFRWAIAVDSSWSF